MQQTAPLQSNQPKRGFDIQISFANRYLMTLFMRVTEMIPRGADHA